MIILYLTNRNLDLGSIPGTISIERTLIEETILDVLHSTTEMQNKKAKLLALGEILLYQGCSSDWFELDTVEFSGYD